MQSRKALLMSTYPQRCPHHDLPIHLGFQSTGGTKRAYGDPVFPCLLHGLSCAQWIGVKEYRSTVRPSPEGIQVTGLLQGRRTNLRIPNSSRLPFPVCFEPPLDLPRQLAGEISFWGLSISATPKRHLQLPRLLYIAAPTTGSIRSHTTIKSPESLRTIVTLTTINEHNRLGVFPTQQAVVTYLVCRLACEGRAHFHQDVTKYDAMRAENNKTAAVRMQLDEVKQKINAEEHPQRVILRRPALSGLFDTTPAFSGIRGCIGGSSGAVPITSPFPRRQSGCHLL